MKKICEQCGKEFKIQSKHLYRNPKFCSRKCSYLKNKNNLLKMGIKSRFKRNQKPWNKNLTKETSNLVKQIAEKRKGQIRPSMMRFMKFKKYWQDEKIIFNILKGQMFGKDYKPNKLDKKIIKAKILIHKIRRSLNV